MEKVGDLNLSDYASKAITVEDVSFAYRRLNPNLTSLRSLISGKRESFYISNMTLKAISFDVDLGEVVGVIGRNGSGKSTLLRLLAGLFPPDDGRIQSWGRVAPLMDLGAGFHPELTATENIQLNSALLGHLDPDIEEILEWANLSEYRYSPVRTFSSGMTARLAFSIATQKIPEVLLVDEVLSVGDFAFQEKSLARMHQMIRGLSSVVMVTHNLELLKKECQRILWIENGRLKDFDKPKKILKSYLETLP